MNLIHAMPESPGRRPSGGAMRVRRSKKVSMFDRMFAVTLLCVIVTGVLGAAFAAFG